MYKSSVFCIMCKDHHIVMLHATTFENCTMSFNHTTDPPPPGSINVTPLPQRGVLRVTWRAPTVDTGLTITGYSVQYRTSSTGPYSRARTVSGRSTSTTISGLQLDTRYRVRVAAVTQLGTGVYSSDVGGTTYKRK